MIILPNNNYKIPNNEKISTYQYLAKSGCPVFDSILFDENEKLTKEKLLAIKEVLKSEYCTIRYQYIKPTTNPIRGGNKSLIDLDELEKKEINGTRMWLLQPIDRTKNIFGINLMVDRNNNSFVIECVGKGFDISDINRGDISPHERIYFNYPIEMGWQNEWWKFIKIDLVNQDRFNTDKIVRLNKLEKFGLNVDDSIFDSNFKPLDYDLIEKLINYINMINISWDKSDEYIVSISMNYDGRLVFWDIQTPKGKAKILRR